MKLISTLATDQDLDLDCDYAMIDLTAELARVALRRISAFNAQKAADADLIESYFWDYHAEYFSAWNHQRADEADALAAMLDGLPVVSTDVKGAPADFAIRDNLLACVECCQIIVRGEAIAFIAIPKHTGCYISTAEIPLQVIEAAAA